MRYLFVLSCVLVLAGCCCKPRCCPVVEASSPVTAAKPPAPQVLRPVERVHPQVVDASAETRKVLETKRVEGLAWDDTTLEQAVAYLRTISGVEFYISPKVREKHMDDIRMTVELDDVSLRTLIENVMTTPYEITHEVRAGIVWILTWEERTNEMRLRYFDIKDLIMPRRSADGTPQRAEIDEVRLAEIEVGIRKAVAPEVWRRKDVTMESRNGILIVRAPKDVLNGVDKYLSRTRRLAKEAK